MGYNPNYQESLVEDLKVWLSKNKNGSIKEFSQIKNLHYGNFRRFLSRVGYARHQSKKSPNQNKVVFVTLDQELYNLVKSKSNKSGKKTSEFIRDILKSNVV